MLTSRSHRGARRLAVVTAAFAVIISVAGLGTAQGKGDARAQDAPAAALATSTLDSMVLAKAPVDECFPADGTPGVRPITYPDADGMCPSGYVPKRNEAYVWGLTKTGPNLWFGTASNVLCGVYSGYLEQTDPTYVAGDYVCETGATASDGSGVIRSDGRTPSIYRYDLETRNLTHVAGPAATTGVADGYVDGWSANATTLLKATSGFRSAGSLGNTAILAGPGRYMDGTGTVKAQAALNFFAFNATTNELLGYKSVPGYTNIRKWLSYDPTPGDTDPGQLYAGVGVSGGSGAIIRWTPTEADPLAFSVVGTTGSEIAELVVHQGRIFGASWPSHPATPDLTKEVYAGLYMSPVIPEGGFTAADSTAWEKVWTATDYEPDAVTATTYGTGALASFDGYLYWGTMQVPGRGALVHGDYYPPADPAQEDTAATFLNTLRAITIFRGRDFGTASEQKQVVYGQRQLSTWVPDGAGGGAWTNRPTGMGTPLWGASGFGNPLNNYTWTMDVYGGSLYIGTMDFGYLARQVLTADEQAALESYGYSYGADLLRIESSSTPGVFESKDGVGNITNYGIRTMVADDALYLGTANPMNLNPQGGWELLRLRPRYSLGISPSNPTKDTGTPLTFNAVVHPAKEGVTVHFEATGSNPASGDVVTDADGVATWSYTGATAGVDTVRATADSMGYGFAEDGLEATTSATWVAAVEPEQPVTPTADQPDGWIRSAVSAFIGNGVHNTTGAQQTVRRVAHRTGARTFWVRIYNDGTHQATFTVKGVERARRAHVGYVSNGTDVSAAMTSATGWSITLPAGGFKRLLVTVDIGRHAAIGSHKSVLVSTTWTGSGQTRSDAVKAVVTVR